MHIQTTKSILHLSTVEAFLNLAEKQQNKQEEIYGEKFKHFVITHIYTQCTWKVM